MDKDGKSTTDPKAAAVLLPTGAYKGSGLALMFECLSSLMVGNPLLEPVLQGKPGATQHHQNSVVAAVNIGLFTDLTAYKSHVDTVGDLLKGLSRADGFDEILVPGEPEDRVYDERIAHGIPLPPGTLKNLRQMSDRFKIPVPPAL